METYGEIIEKILDILKRAQNTMKNNSSNVESYRGYYILKSDILEFKSLLDVENTFYKLGTTENPTRKNDELLNLAKIKSTITNAETGYYVKLIEILESSYNRKASELHEHLGYFILKEHMDLFNELCHKLKVGPSVILRDIYNLDAKAAIDGFLKGNNYQFARIQKNMVAKNNITIESEPIFRYLTIEELAVFLSGIKDLDKNSLYLFVPNLGVGNFLYLIEQMYTIGGINKDEFARILYNLSFKYDDEFTLIIDKYTELIKIHEEQPKR